MHSVSKVPLYLGIGNYILRSVEQLKQERSKIFKENKVGSRTCLKRYSLVRKFSTSDQGIRKLTPSIRAYHSKMKGMKHFLKL